jgi:integrase
LLALSDIGKAEINKLYRSLILGTHPRWSEEEKREKQQGKKRTADERKLSARTIRYIHTVLSKALTEADCLDANPCNKVKLPKQPKPKPQFLSVDEVKRFLEAATDDRLHALFVVAIHSGMRPSELLALRWADIDMQTGLVAIQRAITWNRKRGGFDVGELKTSSSQRCIVLPASALQALTRHRISQHEERLRLGSDYENNDLVFCTTIGTPLQPRNVISRHLKPILRKAALPDIRSYDLRHTAASMLLRAGINPKIVAEKLGHASVNLTLNVYSHTIPSMQHEAAEAIEKVLAG